MSHMLSQRQKPKSNKKACKELASRVAKVVQDIWNQTKDFKDKLPKEVHEDIDTIQKYVYIFRLAND